MTLWTILGWWRTDLTDWWARQRPSPPTALPDREGRMVAFTRTTGTVMGHPVYKVWARRGGFPIGDLVWRNQWNSYAYYPTSDGVLTPLNREILAEIYAMLKGLGS